MKYCQRCGTEMNDDTRFCPSCGEPCDGQQMQNNQYDDLQSNPYDNYQQSQNPYNNNYQQGGSPYDNYQGNPYANNGYQQPNPADSSSIGFAILSFFFPVVGIILYFVWKNDRPLKAKSCLNGALICLGIGLVSWILCCGCGIIGSILG